ncbi:MAG: hypothetical protein JRC86_13590 [Deltaproteobacteria bacterium]|nr:hypothetical protein [Deltaproteobacteria bacterium]
MSKVFETTRAQAMFDEMKREATDIRVLMFAAAKKEEIDFLDWLTAKSSIMAEYFRMLKEARLAAHEIDIKEREFAVQVKLMA